jgi:hypothetical protein
VKKILSFFALAGSFGTLVCCFLPAVFVMLGAGASFAFLVGKFPVLIVLSENKKLLFLVSLVFILFSWITYRKNLNAPCPIDPKLSEACKSGRKWSKWSLYGSLGIYTIGFFFAFIIPWLNK